MVCNNTTLYCEENELAEACDDFDKDLGEETESSSDGARLRLFCEKFVI